MSASLTPMMQQYMQIKEQHKDALLFFRLGDFYEMFFDDAIIASRELEIALTGRDCGLKERAPMCGVPYHSVESYIARLIEKGYKVAICEQMEDPAEAKGLVERDVIRIITPGTLVESSMLDEKTNNYLLSIFYSSTGFGVAFVDVSTGEFVISEIKGENTRNKLLDELSRILPREIIINEELTAIPGIVDSIKHRFNAYITVYHDWAFDQHTSYMALLRHFNVHSLEGYGCQNMELGICAAGALLEYLTETQKNSLQHINEIKSYHQESYMILDSATRRNLELTETIRSKSKKGSLLWLLDKTNTAMGARLLRNWIQQPLIDASSINKRLDAVDEMFHDMILLDSLKEKLRDIYDLERLMSRISYGNANARDFISLKQSIEVLPDIKLLLSDAKSDILKEFHSNLDTLEDIYEIINKAIIDEPPVTIKEGNIIKNGYNSQLDKYREALTQGKTWIAKLEQKEREKTGIRTLKVGFNKVFGYYIDVTKSYYDLVPDYYIRKQTLANSERFIIPELKEVEDNILGAEEKSIKLEYQLFTEIRENISSQVNRIQHTALIISQLDALWALAKTAVDNDYVRPIIISDGSINIVDGRHPVVEKTLLNGQFVPNDTHLNMSDERLVIITGPNMAGKSTYMRQVALIVLMAQIGSFVPAKKAEVSIVDRIFTRVGASDDLSLGQSTFMVEMSEVSNILHNATSNSLLILDEIGRGTSTFDGLSIAWSVVEHIADPDKLGAKTLFATHYHELTELEGKLPGVKNYRVAVKEKGDDIIFLRKIMQGGADRSFGIQVAKLAGLPSEVVDRAKVILQQLENEKGSNTEITEDIKINESSEQLTFFASQSHKIEEELKAVDIVNITPMEAMNILYGLVQKVRKKRS